MHGRRYRVEARFSGACPADGRVLLSSHGSRATHGPEAVVTELG